MVNEYRREFGDYAFYSGAFSPQLQFMSSKVAVLFDKVTGTMLKHGRPEDMLACLKQHKNAPFRSDLVVAEFPGDYPAKDLTRVINTAGSVPYHVDRAEKREYVPDPEYHA